ncbi:MAG TPA: D-glycero-beta-D-manno-heptose 1-phosphate adenylyltransferase [Phycisphaerae bacterium]|nr:D-glycero-beta-D-manno-heptose 1-phosphate adenylyltransferase [Phycisphaerae bacterium]
MSTLPHDLIALVEKFARPRIMLVGDVMLDEYIYGDAERLSPEAPVPVVQEKYREQRAGGAGNVATGLATLGAEVLCVSVCGDDFQGRLLRDLFATIKVNTNGLLACKDRPTTSKTRLVGLAQHRHPQQMLRLDQETTTGVTPEQEELLLAYIRRELPTCAALALEDYNKGLLSPAFTQRVIQIARSLNKPVLVDPALISDYSKYNGASTITPNRFEAEKASGLKLADAVEGAPELAQALLQRHNLDTCLLTLDRHGMYLLERGEPGEHIPTRPRNVYDVTGAGDMVLAALAMAIASGATWSQAAAIANIAGGLEVEKFGIVPITKDEIIDELQRLDTDSRGKERTAAQLAKELSRRRKANPDQKIVFTNGIFDILHAGHVQYLEFSRKQGDVLIVGVNTDDSTKRLKGPTRPVNPLADRMVVLAGLQSVDYVVSFDEDTPAALIAQLQPDILIKGDDYANKEVVGREVVEARGGKVILAPFLQGRSTTGTIDKLSR